MPVKTPCPRRGSQSENIPPPNPNAMETESQHEYASPSTSRRLPVLTVSLSPCAGLNGGNTVILSKRTGLDKVNDDAAELKARRRSRVLELQRHRLASSPTQELDRSRSTPLSNLSNAQVAAHYRDCIKLSAENKINAKNAFGLHLIDYMSELIKKKELDNFQVASSTLDASAKIYAGRVDAIHSDMFKVLGGLGTGVRKPESGEEDDPGQNPESGRSPKGSPSQDEKLKRKRKKTNKKIKANLKTITMDSYNLEFEVDPLFKKTSAIFDEGGTGGLLLNNLTCTDNSSELVLDSLQTVIGLEPQTPDAKHQHAKTTVAEFKDLLPRIKNADICPSFSDFSFLNWSSENELLFKSLLNNNRRNENEHAFDLDAEAEPIPDCDVMDDRADDYDDDEMENGGDSDKESAEGVFMKDMRVDKEAQLVNSVMQSIKCGNIGDLMQVLAADQNDYSHFSTSVLSTWAGPSLWKMKAGALIKNKNAKEETADKSKRKRKAPFVLDLNKDLDPSSSTQLKESRAAVTVKEARLNEYSKSKCTLPADISIEADVIFKRGIKDGLLRRKRSVQDVEDGVADYDYDNKNDVNNYCTDVGDDGDDDTADDPNSQTSDTHEFMMTQDVDVTNMSNSVFRHDSDVTASQAQLSMIEQPKRVARLEIDYAKTAKRIDVKKLKSSMWQVLTHSEKKVDEKLPAPGEVVAPQSGMDGQVMFSELVKQLPSSVPKNMAKNLSAPICFVCLLHLVNEKRLSIEGSDDLSDFKITQG